MKNNMKIAGHRPKTRTIVFFVCLLLTVIALGASSIISISNINKMGNMASDKYTDAMNNGYNDEIKYEVQSAISVLKYYYDLSKQGKLTEEEAKNRAKECIRSMRYGEDADGDGLGDGYFWIDDTDYKLVMHPILPEQEGSDRTNLEDKNGVMIIQNILKTAKDGGGYNEFYFTKSDGKTVAPKIAYSEGFDEWNWVVTTGNYVDDIRTALKTTSKEISNDVNIVRVSQITLDIVVLALCFVITYFAARIILKPIRNISHSISEFADGKLDFDIEPSIMNMQDEVGTLARDTDNLRNKFKTIVSEIRMSSDELLKSGDNVNEIARNTSLGTKEITSAIDDVSEGAIVQSDEIESAVNEIQNMKDNIDKITSDVRNLHELSKTMKEASDNSASIMNDLDTSNDKTTIAIKKVAAQINKTNESVNSIKDATQLITSISTQTNLLSLNASIEAARAGAAGKGFAVVADEIKKLAEQTNESAQVIENTIAGLISDSEEMVRIMDEVSVFTDEQQEKLVSTIETFSKMKDSISSSEESIQNVTDSTKLCIQSNDNVYDIMKKLSSISQQNTASAEETNASMQELDASMGSLNESSEVLKELAESMAETIKFFK